MRRINTYFPSRRRAPRCLLFLGLLFKTFPRGEKMRAAMLVGCAALLLSACSSEPVQQATAAHVTPGMRAAMSDAGQANCAMIGGSLSVARQLDGSASPMCALPNGKRCTAQALPGGSCGYLWQPRSGLKTPASASGRRAYRPASGRRSPASTGFPSDRPARPRAASYQWSHQGY